MKVGIVAGEMSGDYLGAGLMVSLKKRLPGAEFVGIGGPRMQAAGIDSLYSMDNISIMGLDDLLFSVPAILNIRRSLYSLFSSCGLDLFIGVDVPDFNLTLERKLRARGITTVHYVSPTVWAWRGYRIRKIRKAVSHMLTLFPFEAAYYERHRIPVTFVGHPIADEIEGLDRSRAREALGIAEDKTVVSLLPGSRISELKRLAGLFAQTARALSREIPEISFVAPFASSETRQFFSEHLKQYPDLPIRTLDGRSREALAASDVALLASGTAALEAAIVRTPMVVAYRGSWLSYTLAKTLAHVEFFSMPNHLMEKPLVPELIQKSATEDNLVAEIKSLLIDTKRRGQMISALQPIAQTLRRNADDKAAEAIIQIIESAR